MTYQEWLELKAKRADKLKEGKDLLAKKDFEAHKALMGEVEKMNQEIDAAEAQLAQEGRFSDQDDKLKGLYQDHEARKAEEAKGKVIRSEEHTSELQSLSC